MNGLTEGVVLRLPPTPLTHLRVLDKLTEETGEIVKIWSDETHVKLDVRFEAGRVETYSLQKALQWLTIV
jgi:hypothetical protein